MTDKTQYTIDGHTWKVGDSTSMGEISDFFRSAREDRFLTTVGTNYPVRYLVSEMFK